MIEKYEERRKLNIIIQRPGGTAKKGSETFKIALPSRWIRNLNLNKNKREVIASYDGEKIVIMPLIPLDQFISRRTGKGNEIKFYRFYNGSRLCSEFCVDLTDKEIRVVNHTDKRNEMVFGSDPVPTWSQYISFLKYRTDIELWNGKSEEELIEIADGSGGRRRDDSFWFSSARYGG